MGVKGDKQRTCILPTPVLHALEAHLEGQTNGFFREKRSGSYLDHADPDAVG